MTRLPARLPRILGLGGTALAVLAWTMSTILPLGSAAAAPTEQAAPREEPKITVTGEGEVRAEPDMAVVSVGVTETAATSQEAMDAVNRSLAAVLAAIRQQGVMDRDIQTSGLSLQPQFRQRARPEEPPEIIGYRASNNVTATVRDLNRAGPVLDAAVANGANSIGGLRFGLSNVDDLRRQALASATTDAEAKARAIASAAGVNLAGVLSITESSVSAPRPQAEAVRAAPAFAGDTAPTPVEGGEMVVRARVQASYRI